jgi:hypothetical protein
MNALRDYKACTNIVTHGGRTNIACKLGLWSVNSLCYSTAQREAQRYFKQYKADGEYSDIIGGPTAKEVFMEIRRNEIRAHHKEEADNGNI